MAESKQQRPALRELWARRQAASADYHRAYQQLTKIVSERHFRAWQQEHWRRGQFLATSSLFLLSELSEQEQLDNYQLLTFFFELNAAYSYLLGARIWADLQWQSLPAEIPAPE